MRYRGSAFHLFLAAALLATGIPAGRGATYYVRSGGDDAGGGTTPASAFRTVLRAAQALDHGDSIVVGPGEYSERILIAERHAGERIPSGAYGRGVSIEPGGDGPGSGGAAALRCNR